MDRSSTFFTGALLMFLSTFSALGYGPWADVTVFKMQFLDFFDFVTNSAIMPVVATATCVFVGWVLKPQAVIDEVEECGRKFKSKGLYVVMVKYVAPAFMVAILVSEICRAFKIKGWSI